MLDLDVGQRPIVELNVPLISEAERTVARMRLADRAYLLLKSEARASGIPDWSALDHGGPDVADVFEPPDEGTLDAVRVPGFFTYTGFHEGFLKRIKDVQKRLASDQWLLGDLGEQPIVAAQYNTLGRDLLPRYNEEFIHAWTTALGELRLSPMAAEKQLYSALSGRPLRPRRSATCCSRCATRQRSTWSAPRRRRRPEPTRPIRMPRNRQLPRIRTAIPASPPPARRAIPTERRSRFISRR